MVHLIAQISDVHIGGYDVGAGERISAAVAAINEMTTVPDLVLVTGDLTESGTDEQWVEFRDRIAPLNIAWEAVPGNHDLVITELAGHRSIESGPLRLVLLDSASDEFTTADAEWLEHELASHPDQTTVIAIHHPPFETGIWWMDCVAIAGADLLEAVVRRHSQVVQLLAGHVHRPIQSQWGSCALWVCPSTSSQIAPDLDPAHDPAQTKEGAMFGLHAYLGDTGNRVVSHLVPVGEAAERISIAEISPGFIEEFRGRQRNRANLGTTLWPSL